MNRKEINEMKLPLLKIPEHFIDFQAMETSDFSQERKSA